MKERFSLFIPARSLLTSASAQLKSTGKKKSFTFAVLLVLSCLLGNNALAQNRAVMKPVTETIDFTGLPAPDGINQQPNADVDWNGNAIPSISSNNQTLRTFSEHPVSVGNSGYWHLWKGSNSITYLQKGNANNDNFYIANLKTGDVVTVWGDNGNDEANGGFRVVSDNNDRYDPNTTLHLEYDLGNAGQVITMTGDGTLQLLFTGQYSGVERITIQTVQRETPHFDYDPGYEEYDMYDEFSENDPQKWELRNYGVGRVNRWSTYYTLSTEATGFELNGHTAKFMVLGGSKLTANNRIAIDGDAGDWRFNYGLRAPNVSGQWANFSICNLREGDRVIFSYVGTPPRFSSEANPDGTYNGSKAFADLENDGTFDEGEDTYITDGSQPEIGWSRYEYQNIYIEDHNGQQPQSGQDYRLYYTQPYVITEDGHLDIAIAPDTRIVKIKIYSDHQASMVDEYDEEKYTARFDITGELQAMEHIVPGGLEVHVGSNDASQHAHVVSSQHGPVSIINGVNGFKIPGMTLDENGNLQFQFHLENNIPETGTFYKFMPMENGIINLTFQATSMNYYSYSLRGDEVYYGDQEEYGDDKWKDEYDRPNEQTVDVTCPYYLVKVDKNGNTTFTKIADLGNGEEFTYSIPDAKADETYYLYGGWNNAANLRFGGSGQGQNNLEYFPFGSGNGGGQNACGVTRLLEVQFNPEKKIYPLAKWVPNGTKAVKTGSTVPNPDTYEPEFYLSDLWGYTDKTPLTVKKMAGNITKCHPYLVKVHGPNEHNHYRLMIDGIEFANEKDQGGTILIKIGDPNVKKNPVYTLTIAYSGNPAFDGNSGTGTRGHIWDYSANSLNGLEWNPDGPDNTPHAEHGVFTNDLTANSKYAQPKDYGHYFQNYFAADISQFSSKDEVFASLQPSENGLLFEEISSGNSDWMFNYNLINAGKLYDPLFTNKYDLEADNADLIWNTEGTVLKASANQSVMFNEFTGEDIHQSTADPDRYVGILKGGEFRIPWLMPNDRVIIWMGTGKGAFNDQAVFNIRGAYDALHKEIAQSDDYIVGGSQWNYYTYTNEQDEEVVNNDPNYRGCYHFFAQGHDGGPADMVFKMTSGSMCKIYKIQIYRGDRIITNEIVGKTENDNHYLLYSTAKDPNDASSEDYTNENRYNWTLKYFGKQQQLANGTGKNSQDNEIIAQTGKYSSATPALTDNHKDAEDPASEVVSFTYNHQLGEIGTFRMRGKDMEKNMNYVADYADHNVTIAFQETMNYPYTWDFTDVTGIEDNVTNLFDPEEKLGETIASTTKPDGLTDAQWETLWTSLDATSYQKTSRDLSLWEVTSTDGDYMLRLNSQSGQTNSNPMKQDNIFETAKEIGGNQVWANGQIVPEMQGILLYTDNNNQNNGEWTIIKGDANNVGGLDFTGTSSLFKKIVVPNVPKDAAVYLRMTSLIDEPVIKYKFGEVTKNDDLAAIPSSSIAKFYPVEGTDEFIVALMNPNSSKTNLTFSLNGYRLHKMAVSVDPKKLNKLGWGTESRERYIDPELTAYLTGEPITTFIATGASVSEKKVLLKTVYPYTDKGYVMDIATEDKQPQACILYNTKNVNPEILNGGFHLFVPDMHDYNVYGRLAEGQTAFKDLQGMSESIMLSKLNAGPLAMYDGESTNYVLTFMTNKAGWSETDVNWSETDTDRGAMGFYRVQPKGVTSSGHQGYIQFPTSDVNPNYNASNGFTFIFDGDDLDSIGSTSVGTSNGEPGYYNLWGQKLNGQPTQPGIYIVNGKKVTVK